AVQAGAVALSQAAASRVPGVQVAQFDSQERSLELAEAGDRAVLLAHVALAPAVHPQPLRPLGDAWVAGEDGAAVAEPAKILGRVEAERGGITEGTHFLAGDRGAVRLGA